jgi:hypothetical protein
MLLLLLIPVGFASEITDRCGKQWCDLAFQDVSNKINVPQIILTIIWVKVLVVMW